MTDEQFLSEVKRTVLAIDPQAEIWLFGSRARGDSRPDSDWDFLIFTQNDLSGGQRWLFSDEFAELGIETGQAISSIVYPKQNRSKYAVTELYQNVIAEGRQL